VPKVDFYILERNTADARLTVACRIAEKAMHATLRVFIRTDDDAQAARLDALLWTFSQGSFVPHRLVEDSDGATTKEPVLLGTGEPAATADIDVLINLAAPMPTDIERYSRIAELVDGNDQGREQGRQRFRDYRERGCIMDSHNV
jgi:DNA polymerase-3 subunit chi